jgi:hypothetical protein
MKWITHHLLVHTSLPTPTPGMITLLHSDRAPSRRNATKGKTKWKYLTMVRSTLKDSPTNRTDHHEGKGIDYRKYFHSATDAILVRTYRGQQTLDHLPVCCVMKTCSATFFIPAACVKYLEHLFLQHATIKAHSVTIYKTDSANMLGARTHRTVHNHHQ